MYMDVHSLACLRVLFALRLVSGTTIFKSAGKAAHLRCRYAEINAQRTASTPPLYFG